MEYAGCSQDDLQQARRPIASLISKSEKAQQKVAPGTWQHTMLRDNLNALRIASVLIDSLIDKQRVDAGSFTASELQGACGAIASMIGKTEKAQAMFAPGTSQHTLQYNRLKALRTAEKVVAAEIGTR